MVNAQLPASIPGPGTLNSEEGGACLPQGSTQRAEHILPPRGRANGRGTAVSSRRRAVRVSPRDQRRGLLTPAALLLTEALGSLGPV